MNLSIQPKGRVFLFIVIHASITFLSVWGMHVFDSAFIPERSERMAVANGCGRYDPESGNFSWINIYAVADTERFVSIPVIPDKKTTPKQKR